MIYSSRRSTALHNTRAATRAPQHASRMRAAQHQPLLCAEYHKFALHTQSLSCVADVSVSDFNLIKGNHPPRGFHFGVVPK